MPQRLKEASFSEARSQLSRLFDEVIEDLRPVLIRRKGREEALLVRRTDLEVLLEPFSLTAQVMREKDASVTIAVDELEWAVNAPTREAAVEELLNDLRQYAGDYLARAPLFLRAPNRRRHFPYVLRILLASSDEQLRGMLNV
ncbi:MAG TPA: type II toxin-antitoxin system Phd/YefM family antitoxin [bacterium]|jgi:hypothetical protein|nr:type II toxin-antitoxin system Phd/YefM family antitoxin [bacterium]